MESLTGLLFPVMVDKLWLDSGSLGKGYRNSWWSLREKAIVSSLLPCIRLSKKNANLHKSLSKSILNTFLTFLYVLCVCLFRHCNTNTDLEIPAPYLIITIWRILLIVIESLCTPTSSKTVQKNSARALCQHLVCSHEHVSAGFPIKFQLHRDEYLLLTALWQKLQRLTVWFSRLTSIPFEAWTNRNNGLWWADQRPCSKTSPYGACPSLQLAEARTVCRWLSFQQWTMDQGAGCQIL